MISKLRTLQNVPGGLKEVELVSETLVVLCEDHL